MQVSTRSISFVRSLLFFAVGSMAASCEGSHPDPLAPNTDDNPSGGNNPKPASIAATSPLNQSGLAYEYLPQQLAVRVTDSTGAGLSGIPINWQVLSGSGRACSDKSFPCNRLEQTTGANGVASIWFRPETVGTTVVQVSASGLDASVKFEIISESSSFLVRIVFGPLFDCVPDDPAIFMGADLNRDIKVRLGTVIQFEYYEGLGGCIARLVATSAPEGGELFDSGNMPSGSTYVFKPNVTGTWAFKEIYNGGAATITVY